MILVDGISTHAAPGLRHKRWSHMVSDTSAQELHAFAAKLGLRREWSQERPKASAHHYDITPPKRALALRLGAVEVTGRELVLRNYDGLRRRGLLAMPALADETQNGATDPESTS
jgi:hypothetical protein